MLSICFIGLCFQRLVLYYFSFKNASFMSDLILFSKVCYCYIPFVRHIMKTTLLNCVLLNRLNILSTLFYLFFFNTKYSCILMLKRDIYNDTSTNCTAHIKLHTYNLLYKSIMCEMYSSVNGNLHLGLQIKG